MPGIKLEKNIIKLHISVKTLFKLIVHQYRYAGFSIFHKCKFCSLIVKHVDYLHKLIAKIKHNLKKNNNNKLPPYKLIGCLK